MSSFSSLKTAIANAIKANGNQEITGNLLQGILLSIVETLGDSAINTLETGLSNEATTRGNADTQLNNLITGIKNNIDNGYVYAGIAIPSTTPVSGKVFYIALQAGTYTNFGGTAVTEGITILKYNGSAWSKEQVLYTDGGVFDISAYHATGGTLAEYADLTAALGTNGANIPQSLRKGGMSIKFVHTSDHKYVQFFCAADEFTTDVTQWQGVDDEPTPGSKNLIESGAVEKPVSEIKDFVGFEEPDYVDVDFSQQTNNNYGIISDYWRNNGYGSITITCFRIPVTAGEKYKLKANASYNADYAFLTNAAVAMNSAVSYSSGGKEDLAVGEEIEFTIPDNTAFIYLRTGNNLPAYLKKIVGHKISDTYATKSALTAGIAETKAYTDTKIADVKGLFAPDYLHSEWYVGDVTKLANNNVKSVITAIKDVWFEFPNGKPADFDNWIMRFTCVFRPDYTQSPSSNDTLFQFKIYPYGKDGTSKIYNFYRWEFASLSTLAKSSKIITISETEDVKIVIYADISAYSSTIPVPRDDTNFMLWGKCKSTSIYKDVDKYDIENTKIWYGGNKLYITDQFPVQLFRSGLSVNNEVKSISLATKVLPLLANYEAEPNTPAAYDRLKLNLKDNKVPYYDSSDAIVEVDYDHAGDYAILSPNCSLFEGGKYGIALYVIKKKKSEIQSTSIKVLCLGASSTDQGLASYTRWLFEDLGLTFNGVGTKYDYYGTKCEGRGGWAYAMYTGISSLSNQDTIVPLAESGATITEYQNPFLFLATAEDKAAHPEWCFRRSTNGSHAELSYATDDDKTGDFYIFDFARYMSNHSVETPDLITIQLGMNDFYTDKYSPSRALTNCVLGLTIIYSQIRAALPNVPIAIIPYMPRYTNTGGINQVKNIRNYTDALNEFISDHSTDTKLHVINCQCLMSPDYIWDMAEGAAIDESGNTTSALALGTPGDGVHFNKNGYVEFARTVGTWIMTQMS